MTFREALTRLGDIPVSTRAAGVSCILATWAVVYWVFHVDAVPIVKGIVFWLAFTLTAAIGGALLEKKP